MEKPTIENLHALLDFRELNTYQKGLAKNEWNKLQDYIKELEKVKTLPLLNVGNRSVCDKYTNYEFSSSLTCTTCGASKLDHEF